MHFQDNLSVNCSLSQFDSSLKNKISWDVLINIIENQERTGTNMCTLHITVVHFFNFRKGRLTLQLVMLS